MLDADSLREMGRAFGLVGSGEGGQDRKPVPPAGRPWSDDRTSGLRAQALVAGVGEQSDALIFGCGYERLGDARCSATTLRRRRDEWIAAGVFDALRRSVLAAYERLIGLDLTDVSVDECITEASGEGECAGRSPVDRGRSGLKRSSSPMAPRC